MVCCCVKDCGNRSDREKALSFFRFPIPTKTSSDEDKVLIEQRVNLWIARLNRKDCNKENVANFRVCSVHFLNGKPSKLKDKDNVDWAPNQCLGYKTTINAEAEEERYARVNCKTRDAACQTDVTLAEVGDWEEAHKYTKRSMDFSKVTPENFIEPQKVKFYTGFASSLVVLALFKHVSAVVKISCQNKLTAFQEFLILLIRLRLGCLVEDLGYRFNVSASTASRIISKWLDAAYERLKPSVFWPTRDELQLTMPISFKTAYGSNVVVIIDCFEIFIDRPSALVNRGVTWSNYKHHNTVKCLIGITPQGFISFISNAWGGRASDKLIVEESGILDNLLPGDVVMADRGFNVEDSVGLRYAKLIKPASAKGKAQLSPFEVEDTRRLGSLRIHVERVIGMLRKKFRILKGPLCIDLCSSENEALTTIDKMVMVCSALINAMPSLVLSSDPSNFETYTDE